ncbi:MAG: PSD1 and planctomycete cytochrome C domain-containing protein, partial [Pirellulales bacterium]
MGCSVASRACTSFCLVAMIVAALVGATQSVADEAISFNRDVRPILAENCYACHGPAEQEAGLRLDSREAATEALASGVKAIVAGDVDASELVARIHSVDPDVVMPPPHTNKVLSADDKELLTQWIRGGAAYEGHWSFQPIVRPAVPESADPLVTNPIDRFLEERAGLEQMPVNGEADRRTLARRLAFALTGLPPTQEEVERFVADPLPDAYEQLVDRLLASPHHGEEMARHWLDVARYADTHGLHLDNERQMWSYRDWVVEAFNSNLSYDQFLIWQLAGDLLPNATQAQQIATGFSRCNVTTSEGGSINEELVFRYAVDRTATVTNAFLGLTGQCAVCHSHKFDPISHKEFYSLYAFFNSAADPGFDGNVLVTAPAIPVPSEDQATKLAELEAARPELQAELDEAVAAVVYTDPARVEPRPEPSRTEVVWLDDAFPANANVQSSGGEIAWLTGDVAAGVRSGERSLERTATGIAQDFYQDGAEPITLPANAEIFAHVWLDPANPPKSVMLQFHVGGWNHRAVWGEPNAIEWGELGKPSRHHAGDLPACGEWVRLSVPASAMGLEAGAKVGGFALTQFDGHVRWDLVGVESVVDPVTDPAQSLAAWWAERTDKEKIDDVPEPLRGLVRQGSDKTTEPAEVDQVRSHWLRKVWAHKPEPLASCVAALEANEAATATLRNEIPKTFVFNDLPQMRESFVMQRGAYDKPGEKVERATPAFLPPLEVAEGQVPNRLDLARWLVLPEQPLTARVAANRLWQQFFGIGLVKTSDDFGMQGEPPSHPALLDWLAMEYRESGWDTRHMVRLLVTSRAFRRSSEAKPEQIVADPENRLLVRGPRFRLDAEQIRDNALALSGLLVETMGGRGTRPYQPPNIWEPVGFAGSNTQTYVQDAGDALYRRSLYVFLKRTAPPPFMTTFDAPNREQFCGRRERSNTPLQALQLMNDTQHIEAARALAARTLTEGGTDDGARVDWLFRSVLARPPLAEEAAIVTDVLGGHRERYAADPEAAKAAIAHGESPVPSELAQDELAAW